MVELQHERSGYRRRGPNQASEWPARARRRQLRGHEWRDLRIPWSEWSRTEGWGLLNRHAAKARYSGGASRRPCDTHPRRANVRFGPEWRARIPRTGSLVRG